MPNRRHMEAFSSQEDWTRVVNLPEGVTLKGDLCVFGKEVGMVNRFLRTAPTRTLLAAIAGFAAVIACGTAIAIAAQSGGPVPKPKRLAVAIHDVLGTRVSGISADISFTNGLIGASELQGSDPLLQG